MDTPDKKTQTSPSLLSKFEDSPVFNFISTLSPIKSFSANHNAQLFHLLSFDSPQPLQTPTTNVPKESKFPSVIRDPGSSQDSCPQNVTEGTLADKSGAVQLVELQNDVVDKFESSREATSSRNDDSSNLVAQVSGSVNYECLSSQDSVVPCGKMKLNCEFNMAATDIFVTDVVEDASQEAKSSPENEIGMQGRPVEHNTDVCEWEKFVYEASDILNCHLSEKEDHHEVMDATNVDSGTLSFVTGILQSPINNVDGQKTGSLCPQMSGEIHQGNGDPNETNQVPAAKACAVLTEEVVHYSRTDINDKQQQTASRRCLMYEMSGSHCRTSVTDPVGGSLISESAVPCPSSSNEKSLVSSKSGLRKFSSQLPGIGLHLNALAATGRDKLIVKNQNLTCRRQLITSSSTISSFNSIPSDPKVSTGPIVPEAEDNYCNEQNDETQLTDNTCENSTFDEGIEYSQSSPKKKRKKSENAGDDNSCKRCNCKRSKCLKLYCECFAAGLYCVEPCNCHDCFNKPAHEDTVLETRRQIESRNPLAFAPKVIRCSSTPSSRDELNKTPASARHKRGCNCKKSGCLKKYCECFQGGVGCSMSCRCEGCKNTFGHKEGTDGILLEESKLLESASDVSSQDNMSKIHNENQATPYPSNNARQPLRQPFHFDSVTPQWDLVPCRQPQPLQSCPSMIDDESNKTASVEDIKMISNEEASEVTEGDYLLPITTVKSTSPNGKRISPLQRDFKTSPAWKSCRKLILRSVPSFPTISEEKESMELQGELP